MPLAQQQNAELLDAFAVYADRTDTVFADDFIIFIVEEITASEGRRICGWCGCSLRRHAIVFFRGSSDGHSFRDLNLN